MAEETRRNFNDDSKSRDDDSGEKVNRRQTYMKRKFCRFCADKSLKIDYKNFDTLRRFTTIGGKIIPRRISGNCSKHQRMLSNAVKQARYIALLPYVKQ